MPRIWTLPRDVSSMAGEPNRVAASASAPSWAGSSIPPGSRIRAKAPSAARCTCSAPGQASWSRVRAIRLTVRVALFGIGVVNYACANNPPILLFHLSRARGIRARDIGAVGVNEMTTLDAKAGLTSPPKEAEQTQATAVEPVGRRHYVDHRTAGAVRLGRGVGACEDASLGQPGSRSRRSGARDVRQAREAAGARSTTRSGSVTWRVHSCRARWTGCNAGQLASGTGSTTSEYCEASPTTARLGVP